jgi:hypothetical protein
MIRALVPPLVLAASTACSAFFVRGPVEGVDARVWQACTDHRVYPLVDFGLAVASLILAGYSRTLNHTGGDFGGSAESSRTFMMLSIAAVGGGFALSGWRGARRVERCRASHDAYLAAPGL